MSPRVAASQRGSRRRCSADSVAVEANVRITYAVEGHPWPVMWASLSGSGPYQMPPASEPVTMGQGRRIPGPLPYRC